MNTVTRITRLAAAVLVMGVLLSPAGALADKIAYHKAREKKAAEAKKTLVYQTSIPELRHARKTEQNYGREHGPTAKVTFSGKPTGYRTWHR